MQRRLLPSKVSVPTEEHGFVVLVGLQGVESGPAWTRRETVETTLSAFGAGFVGLGVGLVLGIKSAAFGWPILLGGILAHALGMVYLHRRRQGHGDEQPKWLEVAYWACWIVLVLIIGLVTWLALR